MEKLKDKFGRELSYLRVSVTDRCNLRCRYCMPIQRIKWKRSEDILTYEEIERIIGIGASLGVEKVRITGGEPLLRKELVSLILRLWNIKGLKEITLSTNGTRLYSFARELKEAGLRRVNVSLDTLKREKFFKFCGKDCWADVEKGINASLKEGLKVKLNVVVISGFNEDELMDFVKLAKEKPMTVRFIEFMPIGGIDWTFGKFISVLEMKNIIGNKFDMRNWKRIGNNFGPAEEYQIEDFAGGIGFISALSSSFCKTCNRLRLTADGKLRSCLGSEEEVELISFLREGCDDEKISSLFKTALDVKPEDHNYFKTLSHRAMVEIGG